MTIAAAGTTLNTPSDGSASWKYETTDGGHFTSRVDVPKGAPGNTLSRAELEDKARCLAGFRDGVSPEEIRRVIDRGWVLDQEPDVRDLLPGV